MKFDLSDVKNSEIIAAANEYIHHKRDREILILRYTEGVTVSELAEKFFLSEDRIKKIINKHQYFLLKIE